MSEFVYRQGKQRIQREAILETGGSNDPYSDTLNARRVEADYLVAAGEEQAKRSPGQHIPIFVNGSQYTVSLE